MADKLLELVRVGKYYTGAQSVVVGLDSVSVSFERGEFVAVTGESGSGKSTLAHVMSGILPYESGEMYFNGSPTSHYGGLEREKYRRDNISFISQNYGILPGLSVTRNVMSALIFAGMDKAAAKSVAKDILRRVDLWELRGRRAAKLSSGQKQRLSIARALAKPAPILIADEPTGNLDSENSRKIIELLADAAKDRLVILITHEFDEAKDFVTRHIVLQDGHITADTNLRPAPTPGPEPVIEKKKHRALSPYVAHIQCAGRPIWTAMMALFFAVTSFAVFAFLGVFISSLDDTNTKKYDDSAFRNGDSTRIVVLGANPGDELTDDDYETFLSIPHVKAVETWGNVSDVQYCYREGIDFDTEYSVRTEWIINEETRVFEEQLVTYSVNKMNDDAPFVRTIPLMRGGGDFISEGRLPGNMYEIVSGNDDLDVGDVIDIHFVDPKTMNANGYTYSTMKFKVVGRTEYDEGLFFHTDLGRFFRQSYEFGKAKEFELDHGFIYIPSNSLAVEYPPEDSDGSGNELYDMCQASFIEDGYFAGGANDFYNTLKKYAGEKPNRDIEPHTFRSEDTDENGNYREAELLPKTFGSDYGTTEVLYYNGRDREVLVPYDAFDTLCWQKRDEAGITISDYAYTDAVLKALDKAGYNAISVYRQGSTTVDPELAAERAQTLTICIAVLAVTAVLQVVVLRAMFSTENDSFRLLNNIGLTGRTAKRSVMIQTVVFTVLGEAVGAAGIYVCAKFGVEKITDMLMHLPTPYIFLLIGVHMFLSAISAVWVVHSLGKNVYPLGSVRYDIELDDGNEAAS